MYYCARGCGYRSKFFTEVRDHEIDGRLCPESLEAVAARKED